jgi:hypothetical protein
MKSKNDYGFEIEDDTENERKCSIIQVSAAANQVAQP